MAFSLKERPAMKKTVLTILTLITCIILSGCGETISGVSKDVGRMGKGVTTFFFRQ